MQQSTASAVNYVKNAIMPSNTDDATRDPEVKVGNLYLHTQPRSHNRTLWPILISFVPAVLRGSKTCCLSHCCQPHTFFHLFQCKLRTPHASGGQLDTLHGAGVHSGSRGDD